MTITLKMIRERTAKLTPGVIEKICHLFIFNNKILTYAKLKNLEPNLLSRISSPYEISYDQEFDYEQVKYKYQTIFTIGRIKSLYNDGNSKSSIAWHLFLDKKTLNGILEKQFEVNLDRLKKMTSESFLKKYGSRLDEKLMISVHDLNRQRKFFGSLENANSSRDLQINNHNANAPINNFIKQKTLHNIHTFIHALLQENHHFSPNELCDYFNFEGIEELFRHINQHVYIAEIVSIDTLVRYTPDNNDFVRSIPGYYNLMDITTVGLDNYNINDIHTFCQLTYASRDFNLASPVENLLKLKNNTLSFHIRRVFNIEFYEFKALNPAYVASFENITFSELEVNIHYAMQQFIQSTLPVMTALSEPLAVVPEIPPESDQFEVSTLTSHQCVEPIGVNSFLDNVPPVTKLSLKAVHEHIIKNEKYKTNLSALSMDLKITYKCLQYMCNLFFYENKILTPSKLAIFTLEDAASLTSPYVAYDQEFNYADLKNKHYGTHTLDDVKILMGKGSNKALSVHIFFDRDTLNAVFKAQFKMDLNQVRAQSRSVFLKHFGNRINELVQISQNKVKLLKIFGTQSNSDGISYIDINYYSIQKIYDLCRLDYDCDENDKIRTIENHLRLENGKLAPAISEAFGLTFSEFSMLSDTDIHPYLNLRLSVVKTILRIVAPIPNEETVSPIYPISSLNESTYNMLGALETEPPEPWTDMPLSNSSSYNNPISGRKRKSDTVDLSDENKRVKGASNNPILIENDSQLLPRFIL